MSASIALKAPAKVNLTLEVIRRLPDGYHELDTWMHKVTLFDHLSLSVGHQPGIFLECSDPSLPTGEDNLVCRASALYYQKIGQQPAVAIRLEKNIPIAAGLGGGSSDCAATLHGLNLLHDKALSLDELMVLGKSLGADVPFFLFPASSARARGIGEQLTAIAPLTDCCLVLVNPGFAVSTKWVFENLRKKFTVTSRDLPSENSPKTANYALTTEGKTYNLGRASERCVEFALFNDLEEVTIAKYPEILTIKETLMGHGACGALMSGSGATVFGIFLDKKTASSCVEAMKVEYPLWRSFITAPLPEEISSGRN